MFYGKVEICGVNTAKLTTLSDSEKKELLLAARGGSRKAREQLIAGNLRLVLSIIQRFGNRRENQDDLFQVGCIGLMKAIDNFNTDLDVKFSTYAVPMIIGEVRRYLRDNNAIRVSRSVRDLAYRALQAREELTRLSGRDPTIEEIAQSIGATEQEINTALDAIVDPVSLYEPVYNDGGDPLYLMDQLADPSSSDEAWLENISLREALRKLEDRERKIVRLRFFRGKTQTEIAREIGISQAQVSRLEKAALERIRSGI